MVCITVFPKCPQVQHKQQLASACSTVFSKCSQAQHRWQSALAGIADFPKSPHAQRKWQLTLAHFIISPKWSQASQKQQLHQSSTQAAPQSTHTMRSLSWHQSPAKEIPLHADHPQSYGQSSQPVSLRTKLTYHCTCNYSPTTAGGHTQPTEGTPVEHLALVTREDWCTSPTGHLLFKIILSRPGDVAELSNTYRQT